jgi:hypothetical protein
MSKRYVLFYANVDLSEDDLRRFSEVVRGWHQTAKVISVKGNPRGVIVRTTNQIAPVLRDIKPGIRVGGVEFVSVLTSGAIGNLKKRASEAAANGKVP